MYLARVDPDYPVNRAAVYAALSDDDRDSELSLAAAAEHGQHPGQDVREAYGELTTILYVFPTDIFTQARRHAAGFPGNHALCLAKQCFQKL